MRVCTLCVKFTTLIDVSKAAGSDARKPEEESSFWKISSERSKLESERSDFQSLTPSQIKSLEKGEKPLPSYLRQVREVAGGDANATPFSSIFPFSVVSEESEPAEPPAPAKSAKQRAPKPPAPQPPTASAVSATPASISISPGPVPPVSEPTAGAGWERSQSTLPSVSNTLDEMFSSNALTKPPSSPAYVDKDKNEDGPPSSPSFSQVSWSIMVEAAFASTSSLQHNPTSCKCVHTCVPLSPLSPTAQFNTSSSILKTGFDFLDNW